MNIELSIIVPCYNESEVVENFFSAMVGNNGILNNLNTDYWKSLFSIGFSYDESIKRYKIE